MTSFLPPGVFGIALSVFTVLLALALWRFPKRRVLRSAAFLALFLYSLVFVFLFLLTQRRAEQQFVEVGYYYPLNPIVDSSSPNRSEPTLRMGTSSSQPDYIIDLPCKAEPCFKGHIDLLFNQRAGGANVLTWQKSNDLSGTIVFFKPRDRFFGRVGDWFGISRQLFENGETGVELPGSNNHLTVLWTPPAPVQSVTEAVPIAEVYFELTPTNAPPRITVVNIAPPIVELPNPRNLGAGVEGFNNLPSSIHLTSSDQAVALKLAGRSGYIPTIKIGKNAPGIAVNAFLERPAPQEGAAELILNDGLRRIDNPLGHRFYVGTNSGVVATVTSRGSAQWKGIAGACLLIWLLPLLFFVPTLLRKGLDNSAVVYVLLAALQMLLAIRIVLGARAYFWEPYSRASMETAFFAALLIPLLIFMGCHASGLSSIGKVRDEDGWQKSWWRYLLRGFAPVVYWLCVVIVWISLYVGLRISPDVVADAHVLAFQDLRNSRTSLLILLILPPAIWAIGLLLDRRLRAGREPALAGLSMWQQWKAKYGPIRFLLLPFSPLAAVTRSFYARSELDTTYVGNADDPITYAILKNEPVWEDDQARWTGVIWRWFLFSVIAAGLLGLFFAADPSGSFGWQLLTAAAAFVFAVSLKRFGAYTRTVHTTLAVAVDNLAIIAWIISGLLVVKSVLQYIGFRTEPEALLPGIPLRTTFFFEIIILILLMRLLAAFFTRWRDADTPFGIGDLVIVYGAPMVMLMLSVVASHDSGALLVHGPALMGATILITGLWPLWKRASGWAAAITAVALPILLLIGYYAAVSTRALSYVINDPHGTTSHRVLLREGTDVALGSAGTGGPQLLGAIEQNWRMMNYAAEGGWFGKGYGNSPVPGGLTFRNITLDDLVFSVYLLSEEGALAGIALLMLYLLILLAVLRLSWNGLRDEPLRVAFAGCLGMMLVFPALYMGAANVNQLIFTGQNLPLLNLRSNSEILRSGIVLMLLFAALKPFSVLVEEEAPAYASGERPHRWFQFLRPVPGLMWQLLGRDGRQRKNTRLDELAYDTWAVTAVIASNLLLIVILVSAFLIFPVAGIVTAANNLRYKEELDLKPIKERAAEYIKNGQIWFEPMQAGSKPGASCAGGAEINRPVATTDPTTAYQLCMDANVEGGAEGDTFYHLVKEWNARKAHRGNGEGVGQRYDTRQFFQLDLAAVKPRRQNDDNPESSALAVNQTIYRWASPFRPRIRWTGALTEANALTGNAGVLVGANLQLPLRAGAAGEPVFVGVNPGYVRANIGEGRQFKAARGFAVFEKNGRRPLFEIDTISDAVGARLSAVSGDFDLFLNGCRVLVDDKCEASENAERGTAPPIRLDDGDVIAYAVLDSNGRRVPRYVFIYSQAELGSFSHLAWANGKFDRFYPQGAAWPMAQQITSSLSSAAEPDSPLAHQDVKLSIDADLNHDVYALLRRWRGCLEGTTSPQRCCIDGAGNDRCDGSNASVNRIPISPRSSRKMGVTLMDAETGALLSLASDTGTPTDPNRDNPGGTVEENVNLVRHRIGSAIKPFTASAALRSFSDLRHLTIVDKRTDKKQLLGLPFDGKKDLMGQAADEEGAIGWQDFLPRSDNLYAATVTLLGMCRNDGHSTLPHFQGARNLQGPLRLVLNDNATNFGSPIWAFDNMFKTELDGDWRFVGLLDKTPLAQQLNALFDVRVSEPQVASYATEVWRPISLSTQRSRQSLFNAISPEIPNFAFPDIVNYSDLRSVIFGGEFGDPSLGPYGRIGSAWSNVFLAQSFARLTTGRKINASIVAQEISEQDPAPVSAWFENAQTAPWRVAMLHELEGVVVENYGTAHNALFSTLNRIAGGRPEYAVGSGQSVFTIIGKTGTLDPDGAGPLLEDSNYIFTAGIWNDQLGRFERPITGVIYIEQGGEGQAQAFAAALLSLMDRKARFQWHRSL